MSKYPIMLRDCILVRLDFRDEGEGAIAVPEQVKKEERLASTMGKVVAVGPMAEQCKVGDKVAYKAYVGNLVESEELPENEELIVVAENDILAIFREKD